MDNLQSWFLHQMSPMTHKNIHLAGSLLFFCIALGLSQTCELEDHLWRLIVTWDLKCEKVSGFCLVMYVLKLPWSDLHKRISLRAQTRSGCLMLLLSYLIPNGDVGALASIFSFLAHPILAVRNEGDGHVFRQLAVLQNDLRGQGLKDRQ